MCIALYTCIYPVTMTQHVIHIAIACQSDLLLVSAAIFLAVCAVGLGFAEIRDFMNYQIPPQSLKLAKFCR